MGEKCQEEETAQVGGSEGALATQGESPHGETIRCPIPDWKCHPSIPKSEKHCQSSLIYLLLDSGRKF